MPVIKLDDKGRILLPGDLRKAEKLKRWLRVCCGCSGRWSLHPEED
jgi:DNA-binding transcriptional regulator/RsmH inhibitor MraZ